MIIEVDGGQHISRHAYDAARTGWLNSQGFRVLRFWNSEVLEETDAVVEAIVDALVEMGVQTEIEVEARGRKKSRRPLPNPPHEGEGIEKGRD